MRQVHKHTVTIACAALFIALADNPSTANSSLGKNDHWLIQLRDKTSFEGTVAASALPVKTRHGVLSIPLTKIQKAMVAADATSIDVRCTSGDRIVGKLIPGKTVSIKTHDGNVQLPTEKIAMLMHRAIVLDLGKDVTMKLVAIPKGEFQMGAPPTEKDRRGNEGPLRQIKISRKFFMGTTEVTQSQYEAVLGNNPSQFKHPDNPVETADWNDAMAFCKALSKKTGKRVMLPTEAQWEYACRAGTKGRFSFGNDNKDLDDHAWRDTNSGGKTHPVGKKKPNPFGLYDMHGNVWEWCRDYFHDRSYASMRNVDPEETRVSPYRVQRGGSWSKIPRACRSAMRARSSPDHKDPNFGFRVIIESDQ